MANLQVTDSFKRERELKKRKSAGVTGKPSVRDDSEGNDEMGSKNKLDNSDYLA